MTSARISDPPCHCQKSADFVTFVCFLGTPPSPNHCWRHIWKLPKQSLLYTFNDDIYNSFGCVSVGLYVLYIKEAVALLWFDSNTLVRGIKIPFHNSIFIPRRQSAAGGLKLERMWMGKSRGILPHYSGIQGILFLRSLLVCWKKLSFSNFLIGLQ